MWKAFLLLACVTGSIAVVSCDGTTDETTPTKETNPTGETNLSEETTPAEDTKPTDDTDGSSDECRGWGCHPPICGENEVYYNCSGGCIPRRCSEIGYPLNCEKKCTPGCVCKDNYVRADDGTCIPIPECPSCGGDKNAQQGCGNHCGRTCSTYNKPPRPCPPGCIFNGCNCRKGFVYDNNVKSCVKPEDCTPTCQANEEYSPCTNGGCDARNCSQIGKSVPCIKLNPNACIKGCVCVKGYLRASNGTCVPKDQCPRYPPICGKDEVYYNCSGGCIPRRRCADAGFPLNCDKQCTAGCVCKDGYLRADNGTCIPPQDCPSCGGDINAQQGCGINCGRTCSTYNKPPTPCPRNCMYNGCDCRKGFVYDNNIKACVKPEDCTPICRTNEEYSPCTNGGCDARNCSQVGKPVPCIKLNPNACIKGCVCVKGYLRASNGTCVPMDQCTPPICQTNEEYSPCTNGGCDARNCSQIGKPVPCIRLEPNSCIKGCVCVKGYLRASNGTCVPKDQCNLICDKPNEVYDVCPAPCPPKRCNVNEAQIRCKAPPKPGDPDCKPGCRCADNYYRNATGTCVPKKKCEKPLKCDRPNEIYDACPAICAAQECRFKPSEIHCKHPPKYGDPACKPSCVCIDGYVRNYALECIPREKCPQNCPANEEYSLCINSGCDARNCSQIGKPVPCLKLDAKLCFSGCVCIKGYLRASNGTCVPKNQCTSKCDKPNEVYDVCPAPCPPKWCNVNEALIKCKAPPKPGDPDCKPGCRCADNYYRNATGTCVPKKKCEKPLTCDRPNEVYNACPATCPAQECGVNPAVLLCLRPPEYGDPACKPSCVCIDGYVRNEARECIPRDKCPKPCGKNEHWEECYYCCGGNETCDDIGKRYNCPANPRCLSGCRCDKGYWRNTDGVCIPENQCPKPCGRNEIWVKCIMGCTNQSCTEVGLPATSCPAQIVGQCRSGCRCMPKYYRNSDGVCVPESECPRCYGRNEYWDNCIQGCSNQTCDDIGKIFHCPNQPAGQCKSGCRCVQGTWRNASNVCVPQEECPKTCGKNEHWEECYYSCGGNETCDDIGKKYNCPDKQSCLSGCRCDKGYWRNADNVCIPENQCPTKSCGRNEIWVNCYIGCTNQSCSEVGRPPISCPGRIGQCPSGCRCKPKYYRNGDGECIPESKCPRCYGMNEYWEYCIQGCFNETCNDIDKTCPNQPAGQCKSGCRCLQGTWRNASNVCVPQRECPTPDCPTGEIWSWCPTVKCDGDKCPKSRDSPQTCPIGILCEKPRCICEINRKRDWKTGKCIPIKDCPKFKCDYDEEYQVCPLSCPGETCSEYNRPPRRCSPPGPYFICRPQCRCIKDYYRDANGTCVPAYDCRKETSITTTEPPTTTGTSTSGGGTGLTGILDGITAFTGLCLYNRMKSSPSENIIMSAMSVFTPIAELCLYSKESAYDQCIKVLNLKDKQDIRDTFPKLDASYEGQAGVNFSTAEIIYSDEKYKLSDSLKKDAVVVFNASAEELDFSKNKEAADTINAWVESKTNNRIKDLVTPDMFSSFTRLVLINALYFKGTWMYEFNKNDTKEEIFYLNDGTTTKTNMMYQEIKDLDYGEIPSLDCKAVRVYYKGKTSSMIIVLPNTKNGTLELAKNLQEPTNWKKITDSFAPQKVQLYLPLFKITTTTDLKDLLKKANINDWFNCENSGLEGLLAKPEDVCITEAIQKAFIEVNEEGSEAAAANGVVVTTRSLPLPRPVIKEFKANRAFLYYLQVGSVVSLCGAFYGVVVTTRSLPLPRPVIKEFKANRAFLYYLQVGSVVSLCGAFYAFVGATTTAIGPPPNLPKIFRADQGFLHYILMKDTIIFEAVIITRATASIEPPRTIIFRADVSFIINIVLNNVTIFAGVVVNPGL